jgi:hypothetical protein
LARSFDINENEIFDLYNFSTHQNSSKAVGIHYTTGSVSTHEKIYPTFRVFELDPNTLLPVKVDTHKLDITK